MDYAILIVVGVGLFSLLGLVGVIALQYKEKVKTLKEKSVSIA